MDSRKCRFCNCPLNRVFIDLDESPLANSFLKESDFNTEKFYPLCTYLCENCFLVQLEEQETPENIFSNYAYFSSFSTTWLKHAQDFVEMITKRLSLNNQSLVIEIASNDGYLLQNFIKKNISVLGIEPARNVAKVAIGNRIPTLVKFFNSKLAKKLTKDGTIADLIIGNNILAHVPCLNDFIDGLKILLKPSGVITLEFPHLLQLMKNNQFDTIYHEHFSYFSLLTVKKIFDYHDLKIFEVDELSTHGGSLRLFVTHNENNDVDEHPSVRLILDKEKKFGLDKLETYKEFAQKVVKCKEDSVSKIKAIKDNGESIIGYGSPAKATTVLNYYGIDNNSIDYIIEDNEMKHGKLLPGVRIPIQSKNGVLDNPPDNILVLAWNFFDYIKKNNQELVDKGCEFITLKD